MFNPTMQFYLKLNFELFKYILVLKIYHLQGAEAVFDLQGVHVLDGPVQRQRLQHPRRAREPALCGNFEPGVTKPRRTHGSK